MVSRETTKDTGLQVKHREGADMGVTDAGLTQGAPAWPQRACASEQAPEFKLEKRPWGFTPLTSPCSFPRTHVCLNWVQILEFGMMLETPSLFV